MDQPLELSACAGARAERRELGGVARSAHGEVGHGRVAPVCGCEDRGPVWAPGEAPGPGQPQAGHVGHAGNQHAVHHGQLAASGRKEVPLARPEGVVHHRQFVRERQGLRLGLHVDQGGAKGGHERSGGIPAAKAGDEHEVALGRCCSACRRHPDKPSACSGGEPLENGAAGRGEPVGHEASGEGQ